MSAAAGQEDAFPRGGRRLVSAAEKKRLREEGAAEAQRDFSSPSKRRKAGEATDEDLAFAREASQGRLPKFVELLKYKHLCTGAKIWGCITVVSSTELTVALPDGLRGTVSQSEASDQLSELLDKANAAAKRSAAGSSPPSLLALFHVGQFVRASVLRLEEAPAEVQTVPGKRPSGKRVILSLKVARQNAGLSPAQISEGWVLPACVKSVEDHGYLLGLGVKGLSAFLERGAGSSTQLLAGSLVEVAVEKAGDKRMMGVSADPTLVSNSVVKDSFELSLASEWNCVVPGSLQPGMLVNARVQHILSDGLLVSFLTYFNGTVDPYHCLKAGVIGDDWRSAFEPGQRVRARILYVDPHSKKICLSLLPHLVKMKAPALPEIGTLIQGAIVLRVDPNVGTLLDLGGHGRGYAHISDVSEERIDKLEKVLKPGQKEAARVTGIRPLDGLAILSLKPSAVQQFLLRGMSPGDVVKGKIVLVDENGLLVNVAEGLNAYVNTTHASETGSEKGLAKHKVGNRVTGRILKADEVKRRFSMTLRKALVDNKLPPLARWEDAAVGSRAYGCINSIREYGVFVKFFGDMHGLAHVSELGLEPGTSPAEAFSVGQVVKARIIGTDASAKRIRLSLVSKKKAEQQALAEAAVAPGKAFKGVVKTIKTSEAGSPAATVLTVDLMDGEQRLGSGQLEAAHLSDHPAAAEALLEVIQVGAELGPVLVLERSHRAWNWRLTRKGSLLRAADTLPKAFEEVADGQLLQGYVANVHGDSVFVRFLNGLTGRAGLANIADAFVSSPQTLFTKDQSVRVQVLQTNEEKRQISLSLKQSLVGNCSAELTADLFRDLEVAAHLKSIIETAEGEAPVDWSRFHLGSRVAGSVHEIRDIGILVDLEEDPNIVGLISKHHAAEEHTVGEALNLRILDCNKKDGILDLTEKASAMGSKKAKKSSRKALPEVGAVVRCEVQLHREEYAVVSIPSLDQALAYVGRDDFNKRGTNLAEALPLDTTHSFRVGLLPEEDTGGRLILQTLEGESSPASKQKSPRKPKPGAVLSCNVTGVSPLHLTLDLPNRLKGQVHVTQVVDDPAPKSNPLAGFVVGQAVEAVALPRKQIRGRSQSPGKPLDLSMKPSALAAAAGRPGNLDSRIDMLSIRAGDKLTGYVAEVVSDAVSLAIGPGLKGRAFLLDLSADLAELERLAGSLNDSYAIGQPVQCRVTKANKTMGRVDLSFIMDPEPDRSDSSTAGQAATGSILTGRVVRIKGDCVHLHLGLRVFGEVPLTELHDCWVENAFQGLQPGMFVRCCVLGRTPQVSKAEDAEEVPPDKQQAGSKRKVSAGPAPGTKNAVARPHLLVSLKPSRGGLVPCWVGKSEGAPSAQTYQPEALVVGAEVCGYVKYIGAKLAFVSIRQDLDAMIRNPGSSAASRQGRASSLRAGDLVKGRIINSKRGRLEMSTRPEASEQLKGFAEGQLVRGSVESVKDFGLFVHIADSDVVGLVHASEVADGYLKSLDSFTPGQTVQCKVLKVDGASGHVRLTMKPSNFAPGELEEAAFDNAAAARAAADNSGSLEVDDQEGSLDDLVDTAAIDSDDGADWRHAADGLGSDSDPPGSSDEDAGESGSEEGVRDLDSAALVTPPGKRAKTERSLPESPGDEDSIEDASASSSGEDEEDVQESPQKHDAEHGVANLLSAGVGWGDADVPTVRPAEEPDRGGGEEPAGLNKRERRRQKRDQQEARRASEAAQLGQPMPGGAAEFERLLEETPDKAVLWIQYMAFMLSLGEVAKARAVAEKALDSINYRLEDEKLSVWVAWLNLEVQHGEPPEEAVAKLFQRALPFNNQKKLYLAFIGILERAGQEELLRETFKAATRKFSQSAKVWLRQLACVQSQGRTEAARRILERANASTPQRKHIKILRQAALQDFKLGSAESGRSIFEGLLRNYPKRTDLWSIYLDQEIKQGQADRVRSLFERATALVLPAKKMKFLFKRYLEYESQHGTSADVEKVKKAAKAYVQQHLEG